MKKEFITRSIRIDKKILSQAKRKKININGFVEACLTELIDGLMECPICNSNLNEKRTMINRLPKKGDNQTWTNTNKE